MKLRGSTYYSSGRIRSRMPRFRFGVIVKGSRRDRFRRRRNAVLAALALVCVGLILLALSHRETSGSAVEPATLVPTKAQGNAVAASKQPLPKHRARANELVAPFRKPTDSAVLPETEAIPSLLRFKVALPAGSPSRGDIYCGLFDETGWPWQPAVFDVREARGSEVTCEFRELKPGKYAIAAFVDSNENRELDRNWLGMPKEPWVLSRGVRPALPLPPAFSEVSFYFEGGVQVIDAQLPG